MTIDIDALEELAQAATPGPYIVTEDNDAGPARVGSLTTDEWFVEVQRHNGGKAYRDGWIEKWIPKENANRTASFIAAANPAVILEICAELRRLRTENEAMRVVVDAALAKKRAHAGWLDGLSLGLEKQEYVGLIRASKDADRAFNEAVNAFDTALGAGGKAKP